MSARLNNLLRGLVFYVCNMSGVGYVETSHTIYDTVASSRLKKTCRSAVVLVPQASQSRSANYTAHSTHREDRKAKRLERRRLMAVTV